MKKKIISACLAACFSLSIGAVISAETIPIRQKKTLASSSVQQMKAAPEKQPKKEKAKKKKDKKNKKENKKKENKKKENKEASPISQMDEPWIEVGLTSGMRLSLTGLEACRGTVDGKTVSTYRKGEEFSISRAGQMISINGKKLGTAVYLEPVQTEPSFAVKGNRYRGKMKLIPSPWNEGVVLVNVVPMEEYLRGVVPSESIPTWRIDALKAQAVAARTYALYHRNSYRASGYDVTDDVESQVYKGAGVETKATDEAVRETRGEVITYEGKAIDALFHADGGGYTEYGENVWGISKPYLQGVPEELSLQTKKPWTVTLTRDAFSKKLSASGYGVGRIQNIKLSNLQFGKVHYAGDRTPAGRVKKFICRGSSGWVSLSGVTMRKIFGLRSAMFDILFKGDQLIITGYGYGHGLGLSQWGAEAMAEKHGDGKDYYKEILAHYYQGTKVEKWYQ